MRVLVTGASGYIGRHTVPILVRCGHTVHGVSRTALDAGRADVTWHAVDLLSRDTAKQIIEQVRPEAVLHFAWNAVPGVYWTAPDNVRWRDATGELFTAFAQSGGRRFVGAGTCAEYDWSEPQPCRESLTPTRPATLYGQSKLAAGDRIAHEAARHGVSAAWGRLFYLFGSDEHPNRLAPSVAQALLRGWPASCSSGEQRRDFLHVSDVAAAFAALVDSPVDGPVNIASGVGRPVKDLIEGLAARIGRRDLLRLGELPTELPVELTADVSRLFNEVGWRPELSFERALDEVVEHWRRAT